MPAAKLQPVGQDGPTSSTKQHDGLLHLAKNLNIHPDTLIGDGNGILGVGMPGSGKTTLMALLLEQFGLCGLPFAVFDLEGDLASLVPFLPRGFLATADDCPSVDRMYKEGLQVVFDLSSWGDDSGAAASLLASTVAGLMAHARGLAPNLRVPFLVGLDEAAYWLPQHFKGHDYLPEDQFREMHSAFHGLAIRGRKMGLVPLLFTQRLADLHKDVLTTTGTYFLMKHTLDTDLKRYMEYINAAAFGQDDLTIKQVKARIAAFKRGQAVVKLASGKTGVVTFHNRQSLHVSHAPKTQAALNAYRSMEVQ